MLGIMSKQSLEDLTIALTRSLMLFISVPTFLFSCHAVLFTRGSGGIILLYRGQPVATIFRCNFKEYSVKALGFWVSRSIGCPDKQLLPVPMSCFSRESRGGSGGSRCTRLASLHLLPPVGGS